MWAWPLASTQTDTYTSLLSAPTSSVSPKHSLALQEPRAVRGHGLSLPLCLGERDTQGGRADMTGSWPRAPDAQSFAAGLRREKAEPRVSLGSSWVPSTWEQDREGT